MPLNSSRKTAEVVPLSDSGNQLSTVHNFISKDDFSSFTVDKWRNKIFTDPRVRAKLKDRNYRVKIIEDVELTRIATEKFLQLQPEWEVEISEIPLSVGVDAVIFSAKFKKLGYQLNQQRRHYSNSVIVKVWNKSGKQLLESKKFFYENDADFMEDLNKSNPSEFQNLWAEREMKQYQKFRKFGIPCPIPLFSCKNILLMEQAEITLSEHVENVGPKMANSAISRLYMPILKTVKEMYTTLGLVSIQLNETNVSCTGQVFDVGQCVSRSHPSAIDMLFQNCENIDSFFNQTVQSEGKGFVISAKEMFVDITGYEYTPLKISTTPKFKGSEEEMTKKAERKSERSRIPFVKRK